MSSLTEEEARKKICPEMSTHMEHEGVACIGSNCMKWRWDVIRDSYDRPLGGQSGILGYCGGGGNP